MEVSSQNIPHSDECRFGRVTAQSEVSNRVRSERKQHHDAKDVPREPGFPNG